MRTAEQTVEVFCSQLAASTPAPGGGTAAAVVGALGASLVAMVAGLTIGREKYVGVHEEMKAVQESAQQEAQNFLALADEDQAAFEKVMAAFAMPKGSESEKFERQQVVQASYQGATLVPLNTMKHGLNVMRAALAITARGNANAISDAHVAYLAASAAFEGALWNVAINLSSIKNETFKREVLAEVEQLRAMRTEIAKAFQDLVPDPITRLMGGDTV